ncbi:response regulator transcription factor [Olleya aquimaris]|uniref:LuxR family two component transcriptional regulator n=1 Tax=Olleya aquimaris TaxID=639310 RepID=A0A327RDP9_9FLAO|nr:response regulator transcription factor [Olleya aquimaris]RAJ15100.1 LuxR family two component transcriptional regulator [Olleya aquimaris]
MKVLVVDDHVILRKGIIQILKNEFSNASFIEASNGIEALKLLTKKVLDIALIDISMPKIDGIEVVKKAKSSQISTPILILSMQPEEQYAIRVLKAGAHGFLKKDCDPEVLIEAVKKVLDGKKYISENVANMLVNTTTYKPVDSLIELLSDRELEVVRLMASGKSVKEIAQSISLSANTISTYRSRILQKLNLKNNASIVKFAVDNNII